MPNDTKTLLMRKATVLGQLSRFSIQPFPELPASFLKRFPELIPYSEAVERWNENLNKALSENLGAPKT